VDPGTWPEVRHRIPTGDLLVGPPGSARYVVRTCSCARSTWSRIHSVAVPESATRPLTLALQLNDRDLLTQARQFIRDWIARFGYRHEALRLVELAEALLLRRSRIGHEDFEVAAEALEAAAADANADNNWTVERAALDIRCCPIRWDPGSGMTPRTVSFR
jgi:hypothetical protein